MRGEKNVPTRYRKKIFRDIIKYIQSLEGINSIIIGEDYNQNITSNNIQNFFAIL